MTWYLGMSGLCLACGRAGNGNGHTDAPSGVSRVDSAGVEIIENPPITSSPFVVRFDTTFTVDFGGISEDPDEELAVRAPNDLLRLTDGNWVLSNGRDLRLYSSTGTLLRTVGGAGEGPGRFANAIWTVCLIGGDTVIALEVPAPRVGRTSPDLDSVSTFQYSGQAISRGCVRDGAIVRTSEIQAALGQPPTAAYSIVSSGGVLLRSIGELPADDYRTFYPREAAVAGSPHGVVAGSGLQFEYRQYTPAGKLYRIVRTADAVDDLSKADARTEARKRLGPDMPESRKDELVEQAVAGKSRIVVPAYQRLVVDQLGRVWMSAMRESGGSLETWAVFDSTGTLLGRADPNQIESLTEARRLVLKWLEEGIVIRWWDSDGAAHVTVIGFEWS